MNPKDEVDVREMVHEGNAEIRVDFPQEEGHAKHTYWIDMASF